MILLTARVLNAGEYPGYDASKKSANITLSDGRFIVVEVFDVAVAFEIEEKKP